MKYVFKVLLLFFLVLNQVNANDFTEVKLISLKKDEQKKILVKYDRINKLFKFRWTLFKNGGLVIHRSYDKIISQNILYLRHKNQSFTLELKPRGADFYNVPYMLVKFKEFNHETNEAIFEMFLSDRDAQIELQNLEER